MWFRAVLLGSGPYSVFRLSPNSFFFAHGLDSPSPFDPLLDVLFVKFVIMFYCLRKKIVDHIPYRTKLVHSTHDIKFDVHAS